MSKESPFTKIEDPHFLQFLQTKKFRSALCNEAGTKNGSGPYIDPKAEAVTSKTSVAIRKPIDEKTGSDINTWIKSIAGIEVFTNAKSVTASGIGLETVGNLPPHIENLNVSLNKLKTLTGLPPGLKHLNINFNEEITLTELPEGLEVFSCNHCKLVSLPKLPASLKELHCAENKLSELPELPEGLLVLNCSNNHLSEKPDHKQAWIDFSGNKAKKIKAPKAGISSLFAGSESDNFYLKLAVVNELMKSNRSLGDELKNLIKKSDVKLDMMAFGLIAAVRNFVEKMNITNEQLEGLTEITISKNNEILYLLDPDMEPDVDDYNVTTFDGIDALKNLKDIYIESALDEEIDWEPLLNLKKLKSLHLADEVQIILENNTEPEEKLRTLVKILKKKTIEFKDFNFKLAVIGALHDLGYYTNEVEEVRAANADWSELKSFVPAVLEYYKNLEIDAAYLREIEVLAPDENNAVYNSLFNELEGISDQFNISSLEGVEHLVNLKTFNPETLIVKEGLDYTPLLACKNLQFANADFLREDKNSDEAYKKLKAYGVKLHKNEQEKSSDQDTDNTMTLENLKMIKSSVKEINKAIKQIQVKPADFEPWQELGLSLMDEKDYKNAVLVFSSAEKLNPTGYTILFKKGISHNELEEYEQAKKCYLKALEHFPHKDKLWYHLGMAHYKLKETEKGHKAIRKAIDIAPQTPYYYEDISYYSLLNGNVEQAKNYAQSGIIRGNADRSYLNLGHIYLINGNNDEAVRNYARSYYAFQKPDLFWKDFKNNYEVMFQFNINRETYDVLIPLIENAVKPGPASLQDLSSYWSRGINHSASLFDAGKRKAFEKMGYPETFLNWLELGNHNYSSEVISGDIDGFMYNIFSSENIGNENQKAENRLLYDNDYLIFATHNQAEYYVFDKQNNNEVYSIRVEDFLPQLPAIEEVYDALSRTGAQADFDKDPNLKFEDAGQTTLRVKSPYIRKYIQETLFGGEGKKYLNFTGFLEAKTREVMTYLGENYQY
ncbi:MAG: uncharacterized protein K0S32_428 [Bacteroidetes bacterium]|jgi:Flp pilus assembly protein TadD|nr:uncharacterized protein [Bacteroidota bacterium]